MKKRNPMSCGYCWDNYLTGKWCLDEIDCGGNKLTLDDDDVCPKHAGEVGHICTVTCPSVAPSAREDSK